MDKKPKIALAADDAGRELKDIIKAHLEEEGYEVADFGLHSSQPAADYPDYALPASEAVASGECGFGVLVCGTGIGMSLCANKVPGIRCAHLTDCFSAEATRNHNNANVLCMGARVLGVGLALKILDTFLNAKFDGGRHSRRIALISELEKKH